METTSFIKTTAFGGYDKEDANRFIESLYAQVFDLKNQLAEKDSLLESFKKDASAEDAYKSVIEEERKKLTDMSAKNQMLSAETEELKADVKAKDEEIASLTAAVESQKKEISDLNGKIDNLTNGAAAISKVFEGAQKSADELIAESQKQADDLKADAEKLVKNMVIEANNSAAKIVYEAEKKAAEMEAKSINDSEKMKASSDNLRAVMLSDIKDLSETMSELKELFKQLEDRGIQKLSKSEELLTETENKLTNGGTPVFRVPEEVSAKLPHAPSVTKPDYNYRKNAKPATAESKSMLDEFARQAELLNGGAPAADDGDPDLEALAKQAAALKGGKDSNSGKGGKDNKDNKQSKAKSGEIDLDALAQQAAALGK